MMSKLKSQNTSKANISASGMQVDRQKIHSHAEVNQCAWQDTTVVDRNVTVTTVDHDGVEKCETFKQPDIPLSTLAVLAIINSRHHKRTLQEIFEFISEHFPYYQYTKDHWKKFIKATLQHRYDFTIMVF